MLTALLLTAVSSADTGDTGIGGDTDTDADSDSDSDTDADTDTDTDTDFRASDLADEKGGTTCGCSSTGSGPWLLVPFALVLARRRDPS